VLKRRGVTLGQPQVTSFAVVGLSLWASRPVVGLDGGHGVAYESGGARGGIRAEPRPRLKKGMVQSAAMNGAQAPRTPVDRERYVQAGLPWFEYYDADARDLAPAEPLAQVKTVNTVLGVTDEPFTPVDPSTVVGLEPKRRLFHRLWRR